jgi:hypothetical protein
MHRIRPADPAAPPAHIVVIGAGIAGAETALTLALGLPRAIVTLVGATSSIPILPDLVYVPFGVDPDHLAISVDDLVPHGVTNITAHVERVDVSRRLLLTSDREIPFDVLVAAPGALPIAPTGTSLRSLEDALRIKAQLAEVVAAGHAGERPTITIRAGAEDSWTAPACEFALLTGTWLRSHQLDARVSTFLATADSEAFAWFGPVGEATIERALRRSRVNVATGVPAGRLDQLDGDVVIDFGAMRARSIPGLPGLGPSGWYETSPDFEVAPNIYVVGDAVNLPYRAGFATAWQARRVLTALGGYVETLGATVDGIPSGAVEYQMDLGDSVMRARLANASTLAHAFLGHDADIDVVAGARPDKLAGLVLHDRIIRWRAGTHDAPLAYRDGLRDRVSHSVRA